MGGSGQRILEGKENCITLVALSAQIAEHSWRSYRTNRRSASVAQSYAANARSELRGERARRTLDVSTSTSSSVNTCDQHWLAALSARHTPGVRTARADSAHSNLQRSARQHPAAALSATHAARIGGHSVT